MEFIFIGFYLLLCFVIGSMGSGKKIGFWGSFFISIFFSPIIGLIVVLVSGTPKVGHDSYKYYVKAEKAIKKDDVPEAISLLNQSLHYNQNPTSHYKLATCYSLLNDKEKAFKHLSKAVELGYNHFQKIENDPRLKWLRNQPEYAVFVGNDYQIHKSESKDHISQLKDLAELRDKNVITEEEFNTQKTKLLS